MFLSFFDFAWESLGFFPTHFRLCLPDVYKRQGYLCARIQPVDMFPQSGHVETVCLMSRVEGK